MISEDVVGRQIPGGRPYPGQRHTDRGEPRLTLVSEFQSTGDLWHVEQHSGSTDQIKHSRVGRIELHQLRKLASSFGGISAQKVNHRLS